jgi:hypothetical protein
VGLRAGTSRYQICKQLPKGQVSTIFGDQLLYFKGQKTDIFAFFSVILTFKLLFLIFEIVKTLQILRDGPSGMSALF